MSEFPPPHNGMQIGRRSQPIKPCPWCGVALNIRATGANPRAKCVTDGCFGQKLPVVNLDVAEDVAAWNRRSASPSPPAGRLAMGVMTESEADDLLAAAIGHELPSSLKIEISRYLSRKKPHAP